MGFWESLKAGFLGQAGVDYYAMQTRDELRAVRVEDLVARARQDYDQGEASYAARVGPRYMSVVFEVIRAANACGSLLEARNLDALRPIAQQALPHLHEFHALTDEHPSLWQRLGVDITLGMAVEEFEKAAADILEGDLEQASDRHETAVDWFEEALGRSIAEALAEAEPESPSSNVNGAEVVATIASLADLRDRGVLSEAEFEAKKLELLSRL